MHNSPPHLEINEAGSVLAAHGKSFSFAGRILDASTLDKCARLYHFCRYVDDLADEASNPIEAERNLARVQDDLHRGQSTDPIVADFIELSRQHRLNPDVTQELLTGIVSDLGEVRVHNERELLRYCYRVAGTVGLHMCSLFNVHDSHARAHAIDLGIAMQLTNICRDVLEDAEDGRRYLPTSLLGCELTPEQLTAPSVEAQQRVRACVKTLLNLADSYYTSGKTGYHYLPARIKRSMAVAAQVYRGIGEVIERRDYDVWRSRAYVPLTKKCRLALRALWALRSDSATHDEQHNGLLHRDLTNLPHARG